MEYEFVPMRRQYLAEMDTWAYGSFFPDFDTKASKLASSLAQRAVAQPYMEGVI